MVRIGDLWCERAEMPNDNARKRFTVGLDLADYERLRSVADGHKPRLSLQYIVELATLKFLDRVERDPGSLDEARPPRDGRAREQ